MRPASSTIVRVAAAEADALAALADALLDAAEALALADEAAADDLLLDEQPARNAAEAPMAPAAAAILKN